jgi:hypothetical protein
MKHGLTARSLVLPGENPQDYEQFVVEVIESLQPVGAAEQELAREAASSMWKLRRSETWEALQARLQVIETQQTRQAQLAALEDQIREERSTLRALQRDPATKPPLIVRLAAMQDSCLLDSFDVRGLYRDWIDSLPDKTAAIDLVQLVERIGVSETTDKEPVGCSDEDDDQDPVAAGTTGDDPIDDVDWPVSRVRKLVAEFAKVAGVTVAHLQQDAESQWRGGLQDERASLRLRQAEVRRKIKGLEQQRADRLVEQTVPDAIRLDLLTRYGSAALRARDKTLKMLLELQQRRLSRKSEPSSPKKRKY